MVGVPRSRGCHNCRRSRVKCDEQKPACHRCLSRGKLCEGYERFPTFVNRTTTGVERRERFEEVRSRSQDAGGGPQSIIPIRRLSVPSSEPQPRWPYQLLIATFLRIYQPRDSSNCTGPTIVWLKEAASLNSPSPMLQYAMHALAANRVAASKRDSELADEGRRYCGEALRLLSRRLEPDDSLHDDQTLAAARCLMIYELFESTSASVVAWGSHQQGLAQIITLRGPQSFTTSFGKALLLDIKNVNMISSTQYSQPSVFGGSEWCLSKEPESMHEVEQKVYDLAFKICPTFQREKQSSFRPETESEQLLDMLERLHEWILELDALIQIPGRLRPQDSGQPDLLFWNLESAINVANILTLNLNGSMRIDSLLTRLQEGQPVPDDKQQLVALLLETYTHERAIRIVENILTTAKYTISNEMGLYGGQRSLYAVRMTFCKLPKSFSLLEQVCILYDELIKRKGLRHAEDLNKVWGEVRAT